MSYVTVEIFQQQTTSLEGRLGQLALRLNELFSNVDNKFTENTQNMHKADSQITQISGDITNLRQVIGEKAEQLESMKIEVPQRLADLLQEAKDFVDKRATSMEDGYRQAQEGFQRLQMQTSETRAEVNRLGMTVQSSG